MAKPARPIGVAWWRGLGVRGWVTPFMAGMLLACVPVAALVFITVRYENAIEETQVDGSGEVMPAPGGGRMVVMTFKVVGSNRCQNSTQHWLVWDAAQTTEPIEHWDRQPWRVPLKVTVNGIAPRSGASTYHVPLELPATVGPGTWDYYARAAYTCSVVLGVITRTAIREYGPVRVVVP